MTDLFSDLLIEEAKRPANFGELADYDSASTQFNASCGDVMGVQIKLSVDKKKIKKIMWKGDGCIISMASMSILSQHIRNMEVSQVKKLTIKDLLKILDLENISSGRVKCLTIGLNAIKKSLNNY